MVKLRPKALDVLGLRLSPEEGFVLSRVDGPCTMRDLVVLTGLEEAKVAAIVARLAGEGAIEVEGNIPSSCPPAHRASSNAEEVEAGADDADTSADDLDELPSDAEEEKEPEEALETEAAGDREYRKIYETRFRPLERDARVAAAQAVDGPELLALCFDAEPQVVHAILTNPRAGLDHARLIALHHHTHIGLELVAKRTDYLNDAHVQRRLLVNPQLPDTILKRIIHPKLLMDVYKICINREIPERSRVKTRPLLGRKFMLASSDERASLLIKTEGRCLLQLIDCTLDARATQIMCGKTNYSLLFIQNLARWTATPPLLLRHLLKQPVVRQNIGLRKMLLKHPNIPADVKRAFT